MRHKRSKFLVMKILTSNFFVLKILQPLFAKAAPVKPFRGVGGGGYNPPAEVFLKRTGLRPNRTSPSRNFFFAGIPQVLFNSHA